MTTTLAAFGGSLVAGLSAVLVMLIGGRMQREMLKDQMEHQLSIHMETLKFERDMRLHEHRRETYEKFTNHLNTVKVGVYTDWFNYAADAAKDATTRADNSRKYEDLTEELISAHTTIEFITDSDEVMNARDVAYSLFLEVMDNPDYSGEDDPMYPKIQDAHDAFREAVKHELGSSFE